MPAAAEQESGPTIASSEQEAASTLGSTPEFAARCLLSLTQAFARIMTAKLARMALRGAFLAMVFMSGALVHYFYYGNYYEIIAEKTYTSEIGPIQYRYVIETVGVPFLDPGTSILEYQGRTIYKARRIFQESHPVAAHIGVTNGQIIWDDGELKFQLTVEPVKKGEPLRPANGG